ncbi:NADH-ubiquinone oxidoreductase B18 subunit [Emiliania huxleyi CCMP1516]|uniref:NADH dehydrogenase [ubiquinone] 1 beta subcomplex subunit 7 n=2 Tax=Emiliania huxleyi TaxID=2903 RepID=A0A0D3KZE9_EMIH1|nr:NADH-ubiquinone oxidoreductase B18 subunit [Emiliania huxleyi CCMP1516]EOD41134.1 NADH-ubiquinone oxidoreductase B18 subunit [Emiliania huxleyi CCMP1516]|eukprot:XP_005793563.1 NADH-ubiquinone oxidoreductase B18 subunit [Emiliania huxleyi CCMP1516]
MKDAKLPLGFRDNCAHLLIPLNQCRYDTYFLPWKCRDLFHDYEHCQHHEYERRVKVWKEKKANGEV